MLDIKIYNPQMQGEIETFFIKCFQDLGWEYEPNGRHYDIVNIEQIYMQSGCFWCLYENERLIGTIAVRTIDSDNKIAELMRLYILEDAQGKGYGNLLFDLAIKYVKDNNYSKICASTRTDRSASRHLMHKYGFKEIPKYNDNKFAELFLELNL